MFLISYRVTGFYHHLTDQPVTSFLGCAGTEKASNIHLVEPLTYTRAEEPLRKKPDTFLQLESGHV